MLGSEGSLTRRLQLKLLRPSSDSSAISDFLSGVSVVLRKQPRPCSLQYFWRSASWLSKSSFRPKSMNWIPLFFMSLTVLVFSYWIILGSIIYRPPVSFHLTIQPEPTCRRFRSSRTCCFPRSGGHDRAAALGAVCLADDLLSGAVTVPLEVHLDRGAVLLVPEP